MQRKLLLVGASSVHTYNFYKLIEPLFDEIKVLSNNEISNLDKVEVLNFSVRNPIKVLETINSIKRIFDTFSPDVVHVLQANTYSYLTLRALNGKIPVVVTALGSDILLSSKGNFLVRHMLKYVLRTANAFTADSTFVANRMEEFSERELNTLIANFGIPDYEGYSFEKKKIIYSNRLHAGLYNIDKVILFFKDFVASDFGKSYELRIAGNGPLTDELKELVKELNLENKVRFLGFVSQQENMKNYAESNIYMSIPSSDGTSISLLEALASNCLTIVSDIPANREWVENKKNGLIYDNHEQLIESIKVIDYDNMVQINTELSRNNSTTEANRDKFSLLYNRLFHF